jgi:hypothetical protein
MAARRIIPLLALMLFVGLVTRALATDDRRDLESFLRGIFEKHSFTIRNFYKGNALRYDSKGELVGQHAPGYWSRDGLFEITRVTLTPTNVLVFEGNRAAAVLNTSQGEFENQRTDRLTLEVQLESSQLDRQSVLPLLYRVFLTSKEKLAVIAPPYWRRCQNGRIERSDKRALWQCKIASDAVDRTNARPVVWTPPSDTSLHTGMQLYHIGQTIIFLVPEGTNAPVPTEFSTPLLQWAERRIQKPLAVVIDFTINPEGKPQEFDIVTPVGMGIDDELAQAMTAWKFRPAAHDGKPVSVRAKAAFAISQ